jgi:flagellar biosynthetic protein FliR
LRAGLVLVLALGTHGQAAAPPAAMAELGTLALAVPSEFALGAAMGMVVRLAVAVAEVAADVVSPMMGLGMAQLFDPQAQTTQSVLTSLYRNLALLLALLVGLHRLLLGALVASFRVLPPGVLVSPAAATPGLLALTNAALSSGVRIALPVIGVLLMTQLGLAFIARAAPAMQIFAVGFSVTLGVGFALLILTLPDLAQGLLAELSRVGPRLEHLLVDLRTSPP